MTDEPPRRSSRAAGRHRIARRGQATSATVLDAPDERGPDDPPADPSGPDATPDPRRSSGLAATMVGLVKARRDMLALASFGVAAQVLTVVSGPLVARMVGPEGRGEIVTVTLVTVLAAFVLQGGYPVAVVRAVAASGLPARDVLRGRIAWGIASCLAPAFGGAAIAAVLLRHSDLRVILVAEAFVTTFLTALGRLASAMVQGEGSIRRSGNTLVLGTFGYVLLVAIAFVFFRHSTPPTVIIGFFIVSLTYSLGVSVRYLRPATGDRSATKTTADLHQFARRSWLSGMSALDGLGFDHLLVAILLSQAELGLFAVAASAANVPTVVLSPIAAMLLARMAAQPSARAAQHLMHQWVLTALTLDVIVLVGLELAMGPAIRIAFGHQFAPAVPTAHVLTLAWSLLAFRKVLSSVAQAQSRATVASVIEIVAALVLIGTAIPLMERYGIEGAGYSMLAAAAVAFVGLIVTVRWRSDAEYRMARDVDIVEAEVARISEGDGVLS